MTDKQLKEREAEEAIERQSAECAAEEGTRTGRISCARPNLSTPLRGDLGPIIGRARPFAADLAAVAETNS